MFCLDMKKISVAIMILALTKLVCIQGEMVIIAVRNADFLLPLGKLAANISFTKLRFINTSDKS